jgi:HPt (histidine-containing phosphotransfer) domain-containing protein
MTPPPLIDRAVLDDLIEGIGDDAARSVLELFVGESRTYVAAVTAAAATPGDPAARERARRAAHGLKSGAGQIGAAALAAAAAAVEQAAAGTADFAVAAAALKSCTEDTTAALMRLLRSGQ